MNTMIETVRLTKIQAQTLLRFIERKGLGLEQGDPVKEPSSFRWTASIRMAGKTTIILAGWTGMNVAG